MVVRASSSNGAGLPHLKCSNATLVLCFGFVIFNTLWINFQVQLSPNAQERATLNGPIKYSDNRRSTKERVSDGFFNGYPVYYHEEKNTESASWYSSSHCVGENYQPESSWFQRSCHYSFLCFDMERQDFVVFESPNERAILPYLDKLPWMDVSQGYIHLRGHENNVSLGGINLKWTKRGDGIPRLNWSPRILQEAPTAFYVLPANVTLIPFHSLSAVNPGHLVWDDFLPAYTMMRMFGLGHHEPLMLRYVLPDGRGLWASCDFTDEKTESCRIMHNKFWPLMNTNNQSKLTTNLKVEWQAPMNKSKYICARHGLAGFGSLTDHGSMKTHGWDPHDFKTTHNHGRGRMLWDFRMFAVNNVGFVDQPLKPPYKIVFSTGSSQMKARNVDFSLHIEVLKSAFDPSEVVVEEHAFKEYSIAEQVKIASEAAIFVTVCGGGAVTGTFLQRGSSIFIYYSINSGLHNGRKTDSPAILDWDIFNNLGYARVHWLPRQSLSSEEDRNAFVQLVQNELNRIKLGVQ